MDGNHIGKAEMFKELIQENYERLTPGFRKLANYIFHHTFNVAFLTSEELARQAAVAPTTITGFCRELGYASYEDLSQEIKNYIHQKITTSYRDIQSQEKNEFIGHVQENLIQRLEHVHATQTDSLVRACTILEKAPYIWAAGDFSSYDIATIFVRGLQAFEKPATVFHVTATEIATSLAQMQAGEVLFVVASNHHDTGDALTVIRLAREKGLQTICLAVASAERAANEADVTIFFPSPDIKTPVNLGTPLAIVSIILESLVAQDTDLIVGKFTEMFTLAGKLREMRHEDAA